MQNLAEEGKIEEARAAKDKLVEMQNQFDILKDVMDEPVTDPEPVNNITEPVIIPAISIHAPTRGATANIYKYSHLFL